MSLHHKGLMPSVHENINQDDAALDAIIAAHHGWVLPEQQEMVVSWRKEHAADLRRWAYPNTEAYWGAQAKIASYDLVLQAAGQQELDQYFQARLTVDNRFPLQDEPPKTTEELQVIERNKTISVLRKTKDADFEAGFVYGDGHAYPCDPVFQEAVKSFLLAYLTGILPIDSPVKIRRMDNTFWYPVQAELIPFAAALFAHCQPIWDAYWAAKDALP